MNEDIYPSLMCCHGLMGWRFIFVLKNPPTVLRLLEIVQRFVDRLK